MSSLIRQMLHDTVKDQQAVPFVTAAIGSIALARTNNDRKTIGTMNEFAKMFKASCDWHYGGIHEIDLASLNANMNNIPVNAGANSSQRYGWPIPHIKTLISSLISNSQEVNNE